MKPNHHSLRRASAALLLLLAGAGSASAFVLPSCDGDPKVWNTLSPSFSPAALSFPAGSSSRAALDASFATWNNETPGTAFNFSHAYTSATTWSNGDGVNSIGFTSDFDWGDGTLAVELTRYDICWPFFGGGAINESDVLFNTAKSWSTSLNPNLPRGGDAVFNLKLVAIHELGHSLGFTPHEEGRLATMNTFYPNGGVIGNSNDVHLHSDDILGNRAGYGTAATQRDLAASAYQRTGAGTSDLIVTPSSSPRGQQVTYRFTIENRGTVTESSVRVEFYLSTNRFISTGDNFLGAATFSLAAGAVGTFQTTLTIPTSLAAGNYFFGYLMDPQNLIPETDEGNNAVGHGMTTNVPSNSPPVACFTRTPSAGAAPVTVTFNAGCTSDPDGNAITSYQWSFGDGTTGSGQVVSHTYWIGGTYTARLTAVDSTGRSDQATATVTVIGEPICPNPFNCEPF
jgi:PKD repeat protein